MTVSVIHKKPKQTPDQRREADKLRKRKSRADLKRKGGAAVNFEVLGGTREALERIKIGAGVPQNADLFTRMIHGLDRLLSTDKSQFAEIMRMTSASSGGDHGL